MNILTGKSHDGRYGRCRMDGKRGLALTVKYMSTPGLTSRKHKFVEIQILPRNSSGEQKEKKPEKTLGNLPSFPWASSPPTWQAHRETQRALRLSNRFCLGMPWRDNGFPNLWPWDNQTLLELELLCLKLSKFKDFFSDLKDIINYQNFPLNGPPFTIYSYCSEKSSFWHFLNSECLILETHKKHCVFWKFTILQSCRIVKSCYS